MAKTHKHLYDQALTFSALYQAHKKARARKRYRTEVIEFEMDLEANLLALARELKNGTYRPMPYREFYVYEPKKRLIRAAPYRDRIVHQWFVINFIKPVFGPAFISDSYACLEGKGMHRANERVQVFIKRAVKEWPDPYIIKADVAKYFFNIDHDVLYGLVKRKITDQKVLWLMRTILNSADNPGIPVGSYTSQFFANVYLHQLDMFVKHELRVKMYARYMDDFVLVVKDKETASRLLKEIRSFLANKLKVSLNSKTQIFPVRQGVNFCGYKIKVTHKKIRDESKRRIKRKFRKFREKFRAGEMTSEEIRTVLMSWLGYAKKADSYGLIRYILGRFTF